MIALALAMAAAPSAPASRPESLTLFPTTICFHRPGSKTVEARKGRGDYISYPDKSMLYVGVMTVNGREVPFDARSAGQARDKPWYVSSQPILFAKKRYVKYGLPRVISLKDVVFAAEKDGAPIMVERGHSLTMPEIIYVLAEARSCEFQPYQLDRPAAPRPAAKTAPNSFPPIRPAGPSAPPARGY